MPGTLFVVATPIGNLEDITLRALRTLKEVEVIAAEDTRRTSRLLQHYGIRTRTLSFHDYNEADRTATLLATLQAGASVALVSDAGTPLVSDPGLRLVRAAIEAGLPVVPIPGPSAVTAALAVSGLSAEDFRFVGFPPARAAERARWLDQLKSGCGLLVMFEAPHRIHATLAAVRDALGERWIVLSRELTKIHETVTRGWISDVLHAGFPDRGEFTILVSDRVKPEASTSLTTDAKTILDEFGQLTHGAAISKRDAVAQIAARHGLSRQQVYKALETSSGSLEIRSDRHEALPK
jgi:16S rRNA (cytidine1402-2'-O)-methyltransferase